MNEEMQGQTPGQTAGGWLDNFVEYVKQAIDIVQLKTDAIDRARADEEAFVMGLVVIALAGVATAIGSFFPFGVIAFPVMHVVWAFVLAAIVHLLATMVFKGEGEFIEFFRAFSLAYVLQWVNAVPILNMVLGLAASIWLMVVTVVIVERSYNLDRPKAIACVAIPVAVLFFLAIMFFAMLGFALLFATT